MPVLHRGFPLSDVCYLLYFTRAFGSLKVLPEPLCKKDLSCDVQWNSSRPSGHTDTTHSRSHIYTLSFISLITSSVRRRDVRSVRSDVPQLGAHGCEWTTWERLKREMGEERHGEATSGLSLLFLRCTWAFRRVRASELLIAFLISTEPH